MSDPQANEATAVAQSLHPLNFHLVDTGLPVTPSVYLAVDAVWARCGWHDFACPVATIVLIDFIINPALDTMQTHMDSLWLPAARGWE
jgi:hypothetical protein